MKTHGTMVTTLLGVALCFGAAVPFLYGNDLHIAVQGGEVQKVTQLVDQDHRDIEVKDGNGATPLHSACCGLRNPHRFDIARFLIMKSANIHATDKSGETPLHRACRGGFIDIVRALIVAGANYTARSDSGNTPLHCAAWNGHIDVVQLLLTLDAYRGGVGVNSKTAVESAKEKNHLAIMKLLGAGEKDLSDVEAALDAQSQADMAIVNQLANAFGLNANNNNGPVSNNSNNG